jgi:hypothetical protein
MKSTVVAKAKSAISITSRTGGYFNSSVSFYFLPILLFSFASPALIMSVNHKEHLQIYQKLDKE